MDAWRYAEMGIVQLWDHTYDKELKTLTSIKTELV
jgi:hypothetical protein